MSSNGGAPKAGNAFASDLLPCRSGLPEVSRLRRSVEIGRLRSSEEFQAVFKKGRQLANRVAVLYYIASDRPLARAGFVVSKKLGKAVARNRVRRRLKEVVRRHGSELRAGWDFVLVARQRAREATWLELERGIVALLKQAGLLSTPNASGSEPNGAGSR